MTLEVPGSPARAPRTWS